MIVGNLNWTLMDELSAPLDTTVKIRYRSPFTPVKITQLADQRAKVTFERPVPGVCPGQAAVFYDGDIVVGGGVIVETS
jgi:tRNA-specific 2-thiouridylase